MDWNRVGSLLDEAVALPGRERRAFLTEACGDDSGLHADVMSLVEHLDPAVGLFEELGRDLGIGRPFEETGGPIPLADRTTVGRYRVEGRIGLGAMGEVYHALDPELCRRVALKIVPLRGIPDPQDVERYYDEARAVAALDHPNVSAVYDVGRTDEGRVFIVMPLYEGMTLRTLLSDGGPISLADAVGYALQIARGLDAAHGHGIVHRDVKPDNVMITADGIVKLLDFGIAVGSEQRRAIAGGAIGTLPYMAPERIAGSAARPSSDVWSLGVVLYEMLTGGHALTARPDATEASGDRPPSARSLRADVPGRLDTLVRRCLDGDPKERPTSAQVIATLERLVGLEGRSAASIRMRARALFVSGLAAAAVAGLVLALSWRCLLVEARSLRHSLGTRG